MIAALALGGPLLLVHSFLKLPAAKFVEAGDRAWKKAAEKTTGTLKVELSDNDTVTLKFVGEAGGQPEPNPPAADDDASALNLARAEDFRARTEIAVPSIAYFLAAIVAIGACGQAVVAGRGAWIVVGVGLGLVGMGVAAIDPIGPIITRDLTVFGRGVAGGATNIPNWIWAPSASTDAPPELPIYLVSAAAFVSGLVVAAALAFLWENLEKGTNDTERLQKRKTLFMTVTALVSIALSLGVAVMHAFLNWGLPFLNEPARKIAEPIANAGTLFWGGSFGIFTVAALGWAAYWLHGDIDAAAKKQAAEEDGKAPADWKKDKDLAFDPLKTVTGSVLALSPFLTSALLNALG